MNKPPLIENVHYNTSEPIMDSEQIDMLLMAEDGDEASSLASELFVLYYNESMEKLKSLPGICEKRDAEALQRLVHFIAGSAGNLGLMRLSAFYRGIEQAIDAGELEDYDACAVAIPQEFQLSCQSFRERFGLKEPE